MACRGYVLTLANDRAHPRSVGGLCFFGYPDGMKPLVWHLRDRVIEFGRRPLVMGIVNVTPDSFSDGGAHLAHEAALAHGRALAAEGADILDIGGESTRPGAEPISPEEEAARVVPVIAALRAEGFALPISIDTRKAAVAAAALDAGARVVNDVSGLGHDPGLAGLAAAREATLVLGHLRGTP